MTEQDRFNAITTATMMPRELASLIDGYDGHRAMLKALIEHTSQGNNLLCKSGHLDELWLRHLPCIGFPFCDPIRCKECKGKLSYSDRSLADVFYDDMPVENILMWMINGGIGQTYTGQPMADWFAERINGLVQDAHEIIRARAIEDAFWD